MAAAIGKVAAVFGASTSGLVAGVNQSAAAMRRMQGSVDSLRGSMRTLVAIQGAQLFGSIVSGTTNAVRSMLSFGHAEAEVIDQTSKMAARLGMTYGELAGLSLAGDLAGVSIESIGKAATKADVALVKAQNGSSLARQSFDTLGLSLDELSGMSSADRFEAIATAISKLPNEAERSAASVRLFGKAGAELMPLFSGGAEGIAAARAEAERLGLTLTNAQGQDVERMNDSFTMVKKSIEGVVQQVVSYLAPAITAISDQFTKMVGDIGGATIGQRIGEGILEGATWLAGVGDYLIASFGSTFEYFSKVGEQWGAVTDFLNRTAAFFSGMWNAAEAGMGMMVLAFSSAFQGLAQIAQTIGGYLGFDTSTIDAVVAGAKAFNAEIDKGITENVNASAADFARAFGDSAPAVGAAVKGPLSTALSDAIDKARASAAATDASGKGTLAGGGGTASAAAEPKALKGIDSRSSEGVAEMFRLMRGETGGPAERTAAAAERTADGIETLIEEHDGLAVEF
jgi:hypothetical protein